MAGRIRYYIDEHVAKAIIKGLRERGVDVLTVAGAGLFGASDEEHLARASQEGRVLFTQDTDFLRLASSGLRHAGIVYARQEAPIGTVVRGLMLIYQVMDAGEMLDHVEYLENLE